MSTLADQKTAERNDRRVFRFSVGLSAGYMIYNDWFDCEILDVCSGGAAIKTKQVFLPDDFVRLKVAFDGRTACIDARVAYSTGPKSGLAFEQEDRDGIEEFLTLVDDVLVHKARMEMREHIALHGALKFPVRAVP